MPHANHKESLRSAANAILGIPTIIRRDWRIAVVLVVGLVGIAGIVVYSNLLVKEIKAEGKVLENVYSVANQVFNKVDATCEDYYNTIQKVQDTITCVPIFVVDAVSDLITVQRNVLTAEEDSIFKGLKGDSVAAVRVEQHVYAEFNSIKADCDTFHVRDSVRDAETGEKVMVHYIIYYGESKIVDSITTIRVIEILLFLVFGAGLYFVLSFGFRREQEAEFRGLAKEYAHQIGTPLQSLMGCQGLLEEDGRVPEVVLRDLDADIDRLQKIALRLKSQGEKTTPIDAPLNPALKEAVEYMQRRVAKKSKSQHVDIGLREPDGEVSAYINKISLSWVVENILNNASQAGADCITVTLHNADDKAVIEIADNGKGMSPDVLARCFDSGFTTKGTWGVGLSFARRQIKNMGGRLFVAFTKEGVGTTFKIVLNKSKK